MSERAQDVLDYIDAVARESRDLVGRIPAGDEAWFDAIVREWWEQVGRNEFAWHALAATLTWGGSRA